MPFEFFEPHYGDTKHKIASLRKKPKNMTFGNILPQKTYRKSSNFKYLISHFQQKNNHSKAYSSSILQYFELKLYKDFYYGDSDSWRSSGQIGDGNRRTLGPMEEATTFFRDGRRRIDYVLVYEEEHGRKRPEESKLTKSLSASEKRANRHDQWRQKFIGSLMKAGLQMEEEVEESQGKKTIYFIKVTAPWHVLCHYAEELNMRAPLQAHNTPSTNWSENILDKLRLPNLMAEDVPNKPLDYFTCAFKKSKIDRRLGGGGSGSDGGIDSNINSIGDGLAVVLVGSGDSTKKTLKRLKLKQYPYIAEYPVIDGPFECPSKLSDPSQLNPRQILYSYWARWGKWYKYQPLDHIREYFGEKIGIYFAWLGLYTGWLLPAAIVGLIVFMYGVFTVNLNMPANEICNSRGNFKMCPLYCDENWCRYWDLNDICVNARISYLFDHPGTVFYAIFVSFWAVSFLEYWKRKSASLAHHWDCMDFQDEEERPRPEFTAKAPCQERNPITGQREPSFPKRIRIKRIAAGVGIIFIMMSLVFIFIVAVIIYRVLVSIPLFQSEALRSQAQAISSLSGAVVNFIIIMCMGRVYEKLAWKLTAWEMHRTQTEFEDSFTIKVFIFQFVNFYSSIFYIAFFKGRFVGYPGHYHLILGLRNEDCSAGGCLIELAQQLGVIMIGKQVVNNAQEILVPKMKAWWHKKQVKVLTYTIEFHYYNSDNKLHSDTDGCCQVYLKLSFEQNYISIRPFEIFIPFNKTLPVFPKWVNFR
ncbi:unnamed protein product, partial [Meganyctiphanes norvegica]